eukprot:6079338-Pleurochrysis_carterae.AAC.1
MNLITLRPGACADAILHVFVPCRSHVERVESDDGRLAETGEHMAIKAQYADIEALSLPVNGTTTSRAGAYLSGQQQRRWPRAPPRLSRSVVTRV